MARLTVRIAALFASFMACVAQAQNLAETDRVVTDHASTQLVAETRGIEPGGAVTLVLAQELAPGWHVYWKNPGDTGLPLDLAWSLPEGFVAAEPIYPTPHRIPIADFVNFGHEGAPKFLIELRAPQEAKPGDLVDIGLQARWLICADICVPEEAQFTLTLPITEGPAPRDEDGARFADAARAEAPMQADFGGRFAIGPEEAAFAFPADSVGEGALTIFPETEGLIAPASPQSATLAGGERRVTIKRGHLENVDAAEMRAVVSVETSQSARAFALRLTRDETLAPTARPPAPARTGAAPGFAMLLVMAFVGGLILNLMPCVFPVVFLKAAALLQGAQSGDRVRMRQDGFAYTAGVLVAFAALGGALVALRAGGEALGWGFHLQSPVVVFLSAAILFLVGLNLAGVFEVGGAFQNAGEGLVRKSGPAGAFFTGLLAVVVAAPCIGPFLTAPVGAAAFLPAAPAMSIFLAMGAGLAAPFLILSLTPKLGRALPRPGVWMVALRKALSLPVFAGAAYFLFVLTVEAGEAGLARALVAAIFLAGAAMLYGSGVDRGRAALAVSLLAGALWIGASIRTTSAPAAAIAQYGTFEAAPFSPDRVDATLADGRQALIIFTAAWCVNCQVDRATVFADARLAAEFRKAGASVFVADWTRRDDTIAQALAQYGANGVPLYVWRRPGEAGEVLAPPLTARALRARLDQASAPTL